MTTLDQIANKIIHEQELIIGPLAWNEARKVPGIEVTTDDAHLTNQDPNIINGLVAQYERLFGGASREVCKDAVSSLIAGLPTDQIPATLRS